IRGGRKGRRERITRRREHIAAPAGDHVPQQHVMTSQSHRHLALMLLPQTGRRLDVGEQEGDHPRGRFRHGRNDTAGSARATSPELAGPPAHSTRSEIHGAPPTLRPVPEFAAFDQRGYPTVSARDGYAAWHVTY